MMMWHEMYGIDKVKLQTEHPLHPRQAMIHRLWTQRTNLITEYRILRSSGLDQTRLNSHASKYLNLNERLGTLMGRRLRPETIEGNFST